MEKKAPYMIKAVCSDGFEIFDIANDNDLNPAEAVRRLFLERYGYEPESIVSMSKIDSFPIEKINPEIRNSWPGGLKTIQVFNFTIN